MWVQFLEGQPLKFGRAKKRSNFGAIADNFRLRSRISPEWMIGIWNICPEKKLYQPQRTLLRWGKKFGALWSTIKNVLEVHTDQPK